MTIKHTPERRGHERIIYERCENKIRGTKWEWKLEVGGTKRNFGGISKRHYPKRKWTKKNKRMNDK